MSDLFLPLLDATISHLQELKARGVKYVDVTPATLAALASPPPAHSGGSDKAMGEGAAGTPLPCQSRRVAGNSRIPPETAQAPDRSPVSDVAAPPHPFAEILSGPRP
jgi:hypothetical protein